MFSIIQVLFIVLIYLSIYFSAYLFYFYFFYYLTFSIINNFSVTIISHLPKRNSRCMLTVLIIISAVDPIVFVDKKHKFVISKMKLEFPFIRYKVGYVSWFCD